MSTPWTFELIATDGAARNGRLQTHHGVIETPCFMPVGTKATVKAMSPRDLREAGATMILANTFHLTLRPGEAVIEELGGLHAFMRWDGPILTDSGGFQVFSLADLRKIDERGVRFRSPIDGAMIELTPERAMEIQRALGPDVCMAFDECPAAGMEGEALRKSTELTLRWLERCLSVPLKPHQAIFPIVQGGMDGSLRGWSARETLRIAPDARGYAVGGLSVGEDRELTFRMLEASVADLPVNRPRYFMGLGVPRDLIEAVDRGIDLFDCVLPTRNARNARVFHPEGDLNLRNAKHGRDGRVIDEGCDCAACAGGFSRGYLHHLFKQDEILACMLATQHNVRTLIRQCEEMRVAIREGRWGEWKERSGGLRTGVVGGRAGAEPGGPRASAEPRGPRGWHSRGYMPHFDSNDVIQHVTFHLVDSLPKAVLQNLELELSTVDFKKKDAEKRKSVERLLDSGHGACWLKRDECAAIVEEALLHFDGERYKLIAWVIMPNHVHVLFQTINGWQLRRIIGSWKTHTANQIGELVRQQGEPQPQVWQREYWDRYVRDERHFAAAVEYIHKNPVKAGLVDREADWRWSSAWGGRAGAEPGVPGASAEPRGPGSRGPGVGDTR